MGVFSFYMPTRLYFGSGAVNKLSRARLPEGRGLIITGGTSTTKLGYVAKVAGILKDAGHETLVYDKVKPNPTIEGVRECASLCRSEGIAFVVGLGGGSSIDTAKAVAIMATNDGDWWDYIHGGTGGGKRMAKAGLPIVAIPTTAGTGTEADPFTVITNGEEKIGGGGEKCFPAISVVDPDFMMSVHNAAAGMFTIEGRVHAPASSVAAGAESFHMALVEAAGMLADGMDCVAVVDFDDCQPGALLDAFESRPCDALYATAWLLKKGAGVTMTPRSLKQAEPVLPASLQLAAGLASERSAFVTSGAATRFEWERA
mgnify:CR=1 FL=1